MMIIEEKIGVIAFISLIALLLVYAAAHVKNEIDCLDAGFPETKTTITLDGYCLNIEGAVTGEVVSIESIGVEFD